MELERTFLFLEVKDCLLLIVMAVARVSAFSCWLPKPQFHRVT